MFGISPLGWIHTLGSLPAIPLALDMLLWHGRITPRKGAGYCLLYLDADRRGQGVSCCALSRQRWHCAIATILLLLTGYAMAYFPFAGRASSYIEMACLSLSMFLLMVPSVSETLRRVADGHPFVTDPKSPLLLGSLVSLLVMLLAGLTVQIIALRRREKSGRRENC